MYGFVTGGMGGLGQLQVRRSGFGDTIADFFAPTDTSAPSFEEVSSSVGVAVPDLINAVQKALKLWQANMNATVGQIAGQLGINGAGALWAARNALIQMVQSANPNLNYNAIWAALAGQNPSGATMAQLISFLPASSNANIPNLTTAPVLSAASQAGEAALIQAENNPTPDQIAALAAMAQATNVPLTPDALAQQAQMTSDINNFIANYTPPVIPANYMTGPISQQATAAQVAALTPSGNTVLLPGSSSTGAPVPSTAAPMASTAAATSTGNWFTDEMISGVPNWALAAGGGVVLLLLMKK